MKKNLLASFGVLFFATASFAGEEVKNDSYKLPGTFSGTISVVSDYLLRGITQSAEDPALQGSVNYLFNTDVVDIYAGVWGSSINFKDNSAASLEADWIAGIRKTIGKLSLDTGVIYYSYPGVRDDLNYNYTEGQIFAEYNFDVISVNASINYSPENFGKSGEAIYYKTGFKVPTPIKVTFDGHIGRQTIENNLVFGKPDYTEWALGASYNFSGFDIKAEYVDTNITKTSCADGCDSKAVITVSRSF